MAHPNGGQGNRFNAKHSFARAYSLVGASGKGFRSNTGEQITARQGVSKDGKTRTIVFIGERNTHGNACEACWGYRINCNGSRVGQCAEALDAVVR